jgi:hypothetical protein
MDNPSVLDYTWYMEMLGPALLRPILESLDAKLQARGEPRELVVCGGGALLILNLIDRQTRDIDVITPELDLVLKEIAAEVGQEFGLEPGWLNNGPASLARDLEQGWETRVQLIYQGKRLKMYSLSSRDLLASKLFAYCDRDEDDLSDILKMAPSISEIESLQGWVLARDASEFWPARVERCFKKLIERLAHAKG